MSTTPSQAVPGPCAPVPLIRSGARLLAGLLAVLMSVLAIEMAGGLSKYPLEHNFHHDIDSPILAVELASTADDLDKVLHRSDSSLSVARLLSRPDELQRVLEEIGSSSSAAELASNSQEIDTVIKSFFRKLETATSVLRTNTYEDCVFILLYTSFLWFFGVLFAVRSDASRMRLHFFSIVVIATALGDYAENLGIFKTLAAKTLTDSLALRTCWPSRCKWTLFGIALLLTANILLRSGNPIYSLATRRLFAIGYLVAGGLLLAGPWYPSLIELAITAFALLVLANIVALLGPYVSVWIPPTVPVYVADFCDRKKDARAVAISVKQM